MSLFPVGLIIAFIAFAFSIFHLNQSISNYFDVVALAVVLGGTTAVATILIPWDYHRDILNASKELFKKSPLTIRDVLSDCIESIRSKSFMANPDNHQFIYFEILRDGFEMSSLGANRDMIENVLTERVRQFSKRKRKIANSIRNLAKYPPAFGLMGTVIGLVNVMRGVSNGLDGKQTALEMSIALIATMYGLLVANLFVNPVGENMIKNITEEENFAEIALHTVLLSFDNVSVLEAQELLNSYAPHEQRVNILDSYQSDLAA